MKTSLAFMVLLGARAMALAQGEVLFSAGSLASTRIYTNSGWFNPQGGQIGPINQPRGFWTFALFYAPSTVSNVVNHTLWLDPSWQFSGVYGTNTGVLGRMAGSTPGNAHNAAVIPGYAAGSAASLMVIAWNTDVGGVTLATFEAAWDSVGRGLWYGSSEIGQPVLGNGASVPNMNLFGAAMGQIPGFYIYTPEPSAFALTGLGGAALLFRRARSRNRRAVEQRLSTVLWPH